MLTASQLAAALGVSRPRISQLVSERKLDGCFAGDGRARRFDLEKCIAALDRQLDPGQQMGNGAAAAGRRREVARGAEPRISSGASDQMTLPASSAGGDRYQVARAELAETRAVRERMALAELEGRYVLAADVELATRRAIAAEVAEFEGVLRLAAAAIAAEHGLEARFVRASLLKQWRAHRATRAEAARLASESAAPSDEEAAEMATA